MSTIRSFVAIDIPDSVRKKIADLQNALRKTKDRISWTKPENIHLTLKFLGEVESNRIEAIGRTMEAAAASTNSFEFSVRGVGAFPNLKRARILWVGLESSTDEFLTLASTLDLELNKLGFAKEKRKFNPHLTIGRVRAPLRSTTFDALNFEGGMAHAKEILLIKSDLKPAGAVYTPLKRVRLRPSIQ